MVMKNPAISGEVAARMSVEQVRLADGQTKANESYHKMLLRQWCIEQAVAVCSESREAVIWNDEMIMKSAVVPIAEEILRFVTAL